MKALRLLHGVNGRLDFSLFRYLQGFIYFDAEIPTRSQPRSLLSIARLNMAKS